MNLLLILIAWFVAMPLWLSITITVLCGIKIIWLFCTAFGKVAKESENRFPKL